MINILLHFLYSCDMTTILLFIFFLIYFIIIDKINKNKILFLIPLIVSIIHCILFVSGSAFFDIIFEYKYLYIFSYMIALYPIYINNKILKIISKIIIIISFVIFITISLYSGKTVNFTRKSLSDSYISLCNYLEKNYIMNEWKKIDYDKLRSEGLLLVKEAEETNNINKYYEALDELVNSFYDGHMGLYFYNDSDYYRDKLNAFNDYGLTLLTLDNGDTIAVMVDEGLEIKSGNVVTKWNGKDIDKAIDEVKLPIGEELIDNERIKKTFYLSGVGDDTVEITFIDDNNKEKTIKLNKTNSEIPRSITAISMFNNNLSEDETEYEMLNDNTGYLKIVDEEIDYFSDSISYVTGNHKVAREKYRNILRELKEKGMTKLVLDIRNNAGGYDVVSTAVASLFTKEKMFAYSLGIKTSNGYKGLENQYILPDGEFSDIDVVVLTNMRCGSAGDGMVLYLSIVSNITIAGLSNPGGYNQETGGIIYLPKGAVIYFPVGVILDQDGNPNIDIDETRMSRNPVDVKIPLDKETALELFDGKDIELEWAVNYLNK